MTTKPPPIKSVFITKHNGQQVKDILAVEKALAIDIIYGQAHNRTSHRLLTTMRSPQHDQELVVGLLYWLGIIDSPQEIIGIDACMRNKHPTSYIDRISVHLAYGKLFLPPNFSFGHGQHSSCGVCGIENLPKTHIPTSDQISAIISAALLKTLLKKMAHTQKIFKKTGGTHSAALFNKSGHMLANFEDVGRHNALDKLVGHMLLNQCQQNDVILLLSSRASFEIIEKAARAQIKIIAVMGAVSSLAAQLAEKYHVTLVGFLRDNRFNIYSHAHRIL